jgi:DNA-binding response OmpR family regulator
METSSVDLLFVEDNPYEAELTIRNLKKANIANKLKHIDDGAAALDFIFSPEFLNQKPRTKLIILDLKLPKVDGLEILKRLKSDNRTQVIPVVVLTSSREEKDVLESYKLGANSYIVKPVNFESFSKAVAELGLYWVVLNQAPEL